VPHRPVARAAANATLSRGWTARAGGNRHTTFTRGGADLGRACRGPAGGWIVAAPLPGAPASGRVGPPSGAVVARPLALVRAQRPPANRTPPDGGRVNVSVDGLRLWLGAPACRRRFAADGRARSQRGSTGATCHRNSSLFSRPRPLIAVR